MSEPLKVDASIRLPTEAQLAALLCVMNDTPTTDPFDGSPNWWGFAFIAKAMLAGVTGGRIVLTGIDATDSESPPKWGGQ